MKKIYPLPFLALFLSHPLAAVDVVTVKDGGGNVVNGQAITVLAPASTWEMEEDLVSNLNGGSARVVNLKRYEMGYASGSQNYFCWGVCYLPEVAGNRPTWVSIDPVNMSPGVDFTGFHAYYRPMGTTGISTFRFVWFAVDDPTDTAYVDIVFDTQNVGIADLPGLTTGLEVFPNPVNGGEATVALTGLGGRTGARVVLYNSLGDKARTVLIGTTDRALLNVADLPPGVYFATLEVQGRILVTRRVVVSSH